MKLKADNGEIAFDVRMGDTDFDPNGVEQEEELDFNSIKIDGKPIEFYELSPDKREEVRELINYYR